MLFILYYYNTMKNNKNINNTWETFSWENEEIIKIIYNHWWNMGYRKEKEKIDPIYYKFIGEEITKKELAKTLAKVLPREQLKWNTEELEEKIGKHRYLTKWTNTINDIITALRERKLTKKEYAKILDQIKKYNSILPTTNKRKFSYWWWNGNVILSETTGKMYCVENDNDREQLIKDYNGYQYYISRIWASGAWNIKAWKKTLIYLPTVRKDVAYPYNEYQDHTVNDLNIFARSDRWIVDKSQPVTIKPQKNNEPFVFIDPNYVQEIISIIKSGGKLPKDYKIFREKLGDYYLDNSWQKTEIIAKYISNKKWPRNVVKDVMRNTGYLNRFESELKPSSSEFNRVIGLHQTEKNNWIALDKDWLGVWFNEKYPTEIENPKDLYEYVVWDANRITKEYYHKIPKKKIRGREFINKDTAIRTNIVRRNRYNHDSNEWKYVAEKEKAILHRINIDDLWFDNIILGSWKNKDREANNYTRIAWANSYNNYDLTVNNTKISLNYVINKKELTLMITDLPPETSEAEVKHILNNISKDDIIKNIHYYYKDIIRKSFYDIKTQIKRNIKDKDTQTIWEEEIQNTEKWHLRNIQWNLMYRYFGDKVYLWYIILNEDINPKFKKNRVKVWDFEYIISRKEFDNTNIQERDKYMKNKVYDKAIKYHISDLKYSREQEKQIALTLLKQNPDAIFTLWDSYAVWNYESGTKWFMQRFNLTAPLSAKKILEHPELDSMINNHKFTKIFVHKHMKKRLEETKTNTNNVTTPTRGKRK